MSLQGRKPDRAPGTPVPRTAHAGGRRKDALPAPQARAPPTARGSQGGVFLLSSSLRRRAGPHRRVSPSSCRRGPSALSPGLTQHPCVTLRFSPAGILAFSFYPVSRHGHRSQLCSGGVEITSCFQSQTWKSPIRARPVQVKTRPHKTVLC